MIEKKIIKDILKEHDVEKFLKQNLDLVPIENITLEKTSLGEKVTIKTSLPGLVIGREGSKIKELTELLREKFDFQNPQIKIDEVKDSILNSKIVAKMIARDLTKFGSQKFKLTAFKYMTQALNNGAQGIEIRISGKLPSSRAKSWRFSKGYLKKTGYISDFVMEKAVEHANLKTGTIGIKVMILKDDVVLPDRIIKKEDLARLEIEKEIQLKKREEDNDKRETERKEFRRKKFENRDKEENRK